MFFNAQDILYNEWYTIDKAVHRADISATLVADINNHSYLKFSLQKFVCPENGTLTLPASVVVSSVTSVFVVRERNFGNWYR